MGVGGRRGPNSGLKDWLKKIYKRKIKIKNLKFKIWNLELEKSIWKNSINIGRIFPKWCGYPPEVNTVFDDEKQNRRNDELFLQKSTLILMMKSKTEEMMSYSSGSRTDFNNKNRRNVGGNLPKLLRHSSGIQTNFDNEK